jgi:small subunit ribosomal protein S6
MPKDPILYDLVLLLSTETDEDKRTNLVGEIETMIAAAGGSVSRKQAWGQRPTTYRIDHQTEADYHLLQFTGPTPLLESLSHTLRIADAVLRFRIIKVVPGTPEAPEGAPPVLAGAGGVTAAAAAEGEAA